ncbi:MAG TPA: S8 family serine peptidase [Anaerolineales bacterium]|nr:S8 family serine peptidase [Anaerolineales bacterium]
MTSPVLQRLWSVLLISGILLSLAHPADARAGTLDIPASQGEDKIEAALMSQLSAQGQHTDFIVRFAEQADLSAAYDMDWEARGQFVYSRLSETARRSQAKARGFLDAMGLEYRTFIAGNELYVDSGNLKAAYDLASLGEVASIRATRTYHIEPPQPSNPAAGLHWAGDLLAYDMLAAPTASGSSLAWGISYARADDFWSFFDAEGQGIVVANIDTGVQWTHPALDQSYKCSANPADPACWFDPAGTCTTGPCDPDGHGTHTMGTMVGDNDASLAYQVGMAPDAQWIACRGCVGESCSDLAVNACADWILAPGGDPANRPHVVNNSWDGARGDLWYQAKVQAWVDAGIFPAFSAGNGGSGCATLTSPGEYPESFTSGAHDMSGGVAFFSSRGPGSFDDIPYTKPNISAPGVNVCSSYPTNKYACINGTSMASPHSAGAVALLWACNPGLVGQIDKTFQLLQDTASAAPAGSCGAPLSGQGNYSYGYGHLDVYAAGLQACGSTGYLAGAVTDSASGDPIAGVVVTAVSGLVSSSPSAVTDAAGAYQIMALTGVYTVTAVHPEYATEIDSGVEVTAAMITVQDIAMTRRGMLLGYARDADNGFGLGGAAVDADDGTSVVTRPDGSYEMYLDEGLHVVTVTMQNYAPASALVDMRSGVALQQDFMLTAWVAFVPGPVHAWLDWDATGTLTGSLYNRLPLPYDFEFEEGSTDVPWLGENPLTSTIPASSTLPGDLPFTLSFTATLAAGIDQPGDYNTILNLTGSPSLTIPVTMTVAPPAGMGHLHGNVVDNCTLDAVDAWVEIVDGDPVSSTLSVPDNGYYSAWLYTGEYEVIFGGANYLSATAAVDISAQGDVWLDVSLVPDRPCVAVTDELIEAWVLSGTAVYTDPFGVEIINNGGQALQYEIVKQPGRIQLDGGIAAASPDVLLLHAGDNIVTIRSQLLALGGLGVVDGFDARYATPALAQLQAYDVVITWSAALYQDPTGIGNVLADYVDGGGKVINMMFALGTDFWAMGGRFMDEAYTAMNGTIVLSTASCLGTYNAEHPIMAGVPAICEAYPLDATYLTTGSEEVARFQNDELFVAVKTGRTVVSIAGYIWTTGMDVVMHNAILWLVGVSAVDLPWTRVEPVIGTIPAGERVNVAIVMSALSNTLPLPLGDYAAEYAIIENSPLGEMPRFDVLMHIADEFLAPAATFDVDGDHCLGDVVVLTDTTQAGIPPGIEGQWDFGDGVTMTAGAENVSHTYAAAGVYTITLTACNEFGCDTEDAVIAITVPPTPSFAQFAHGLTLALTNTSLGAASYLWDFGDGVTSTLASPTHAYVASGAYTVTLWAINNCGMGVVEKQVVVMALADLALNKSARPDAVLVGDEVTYTLSLANHGPDDALNAALTDTLPISTTFVSASLPCTHAAGVVSCELGVLDSGEVLTAEVVVTADALGLLTNRAWVWSATFDPHEEDNDTAADVIVSRHLADLSSLNEGPALVKQGDILTYTLTVNNAGPDPALAVVLTDTLPAGIAFVSADASCNHMHGIVICNLGDIVPGGVAAVEIVAAANAAGVFTNLAVVRSAVVDPDGDNNDAALETTVRAVTADLSLVKSGPALAKVGEMLVYTLTITNAGPDGAFHVMVTDTLPVEVTFISADALCLEAAHIVTCDLGNLASGDEASVEIVTRAGGAGLLINRAAAWSELLDPNSANNGAIFETLVQTTTADLLLVKDGLAVVGEGETIAYTLTVTNAGPDDAVQVKLVDTLPLSVTFVSATAPCLHAISVVTCELGNIPIDSTQVISITVAAPEVSGSLVNHAILTSHTADPDETNNADAFEALIVKDEWVVFVPICLLGSRVSR